MNIKIIHTKNLKWIDVINPTELEIAYLKKNFDFHPLDFQDLSYTSQHAKVEDRDSYQFLVLLFPVFNKKNREIRPAEVDFFIGKDFLITIHDGSMYTMTNLYNSVSTHDVTRQQYMGKNSGFLLFEILESLFKRSFPILDNINKDMTEIESTIFQDLSLSMLKRISLTKRNIIDFRRIMKTHHLILRKLMNNKQPFMVFADYKNYYMNLLDHAENIWDILAIQKETADALQDANQSLATNTLNQITKLITILSGVFLPATLVLFAFGLSINNLPLRDDPNAFLIILGISAISSGIVVAYFKTKHWF